MRTRSPGFFFRVALVVLSVFAVVAYVLSKKFIDAVAEGDLLSFTSLTIVKFKAFGLFTFYAAKDTTITSDDVDGAILLSISAIAFFVSVFLDVAVERARDRVQWFFLLAWLGAGYLAADELFSIHETIGNNLGFLADAPGVEHPDDVIMLAYGIPALAFLIAFRREMLASRRAVRFLLAGLAFFVLTTLIDPFVTEIAQPLQIIGSLFLFAGFVALAVHHLASASVDQQLLQTRHGSPGDLVSTRS